MSPGQPHVFVIVGDCLRAASTTAETMPYVTRSADLSFDRCFAPSTWTFPSFATLYSGETPVEHGATRRGEVLDPSRAELPRLAGENGYYTAIFSENPTFSQKYGFHHAVDLADDSINFKPFVSPFSAENYMNRLTAGNVWAVTKELLRRPGRLRNAANTSYGAFAYLREHSKTTFPHHGGRVFDHVDAVARSRGERPLFCIANFLEPHDPHHAPPAEAADEVGIEVPAAEREALWTARDTKEYLLRSDPRVPDGADSHFDSWAEILQREEAVYRAQIRHFDALFERWYEGLPATVRENAIVVVTGDHGQLFGEEGMAHHQTSLHPKGVEVPLYAFLPEDWDAADGRGADDPATGGRASDCSWLGLSRALSGMVEGEIAGTRGFTDAITGGSATDDAIVVTVDGPCWNTSVLEEADRGYDRERIEALKVRRIGLVDGDEQVVHESRWNDAEIATNRYELAGDTRRLVERDADVVVDPEHREWLLEPTDDDDIDARASARLEQLGYL